MPCNNITFTKNEKKALEFSYFSKKTLHRFSSCPLPFPPWEMMVCGVVSHLPTFVDDAPSSLTAILYRTFQNWIFSLWDQCIISQIRGNILFANENFSTCRSCHQVFFSFFILVTMTKKCYEIFKLKGTVSRKLRPMLLYIIQKLFSRPIIAGHKILILLKGHFTIIKKPISVS